jgi:hypothetical protein
MPRIISGINVEHSRPENLDLIDALVDELRSNRDSGQPVILEHHFPKTGKMKVTVLWDRWDDVPYEQRAYVIQRAYVKAGIDSGEKLGLLIGLTFPEAYDEGLLPYQIVPLLRRGDSVSLRQCYEAMINEGASRLFPVKQPVLRFTDEAEADKVRQRLIGQLPGSTPVWSILKEVGVIQPVSTEQ